MLLDTLEPLEMASGCSQSLWLSHAKPDWVGRMRGVKFNSALTRGSPLGKSSLNIVLGVLVSVRFISSP
jgi:hypothetical protein